MGKLIIHLLFSLITELSLLKAHVSGIEEGEAGPRASMWGSNGSICYSMTAVGVAQACWTEWPPPVPKLFVNTCSN